jgi:Neuraminidase (sialidase)
MTLETISEGWVSRRQSNSTTAVAAGPRCAVTNEGEVVCSFMVQSKLGINDFKPMLARSRDGGRTWAEEHLLWPRLLDRYSIFGSVSQAPDGNLYYFGSRFLIDTPGETFWSDATQGLKANELIWSKSADGGRTWAEPEVIPMPIQGAAEAPGALTVMRSGRMICCYAPYNTFDPELVVDRNQIVALHSDDQGRSWQYKAMIRFESEHSTGAEAWVIELADGRLLGTTWHLNQQDKSDHPNAYALSLDGGDTWQPTRSTDILGQSTSLAALPDGRALFIYNQRRHGDPGVWLAVVRPTAYDFGVESNEIAWRAQTRTQSGTSGEHTEWTDFSFGEPAVALLPDPKGLGNTLLLVLWCVEPGGQGIRYVRLRIP